VPPSIDLIGAAWAGDLAATRLLFLPVRAKLDLNESRNFPTGSGSGAHEIRASLTLILEQFTANRTSRNQAARGKDNGESRLGDGEYQLEQDSTQTKIKKASILKKS
jgi:hypothetical protein